MNSDWLRDRVDDLVMLIAWHTNTFFPDNHSYNLYNNIKVNKKG